MNRFILIKAGSTYPNIARKYGDFEDWTCKGLGVDPKLLSIIEIQNDHKLPDPKKCSGVVVTGSHSMVTDGYDWIGYLSEWVGKLVDCQIPFLGICFGHQLLAKSCGGSVDYHPRGKEIGTVDIDLLPASSTDRLFGGFPNRFRVHVTHSQTVLSLPTSAIRLAANTFDSCQAIRIGDSAWGVQFHPEYKTEVLKAYIDEQVQELSDGGQNILQIYGTVRETPHAACILSRFTKVVTENLKHGIK